MKQVHRFELTNPQRPDHLLQLFRVAQKRCIPAEAILGQDPKRCRPLTVNPTGALPALKLFKVEGSQERVRAGVTAVQEVHNT